MMNPSLWLWMFLACVVFTPPKALAAQEGYYGIRVVDAETSLGVPLIQLRTVHHVSYWTDSMGYVAIHEPDWLGQEVFFHVEADGYEVAADGFGYEGVRLHPQPGRVDEIVVRRTQAAERMYRMTGADRYRDSRLLGVPIPVGVRAQDGKVVGQDSSQAVVYRDRIHWFWGDTSVFRYPLGNFRSSGALSRLPRQGGMSPDQGVVLEYFVNQDGQVAQMCPMPPRGDLIWIDGLLVVEDDQGQERMVAHYSKRKSLAEQMEHGLVVFEDQTQRFQLLKTFDLDNTWQHPRGHPIRVRQSGKVYFQFGDVYYHIRVPANWKALQDPDQYESFDPKAEGEAGCLWRKHQAPVSIEKERSWIESGAVSAADAWMQPKDVETGAKVNLHRGSVRWNEHRKKYVLIANQIGGTSMLGEVWYGEALRPEGPWLKVVKVATHADYSYYNPVQRSFFDTSGGRIIYFEGTYTTTFSGNQDPVPRYDYNQLMYRLDLDHPMLKRLR